MSDQVKVKQIAHLQLDAAQHFFLAIHNGTQIHVSGDLAPMDMVVAVLSSLRAMGISHDDAVQVIREQAAKIWTSGSDQAIILASN